MGLLLSIFMVKNMSNVLWMLTGNTYKCYRNSDGRVLGGVIEVEGTYKAYYFGDFIGEYISQQTAVDAVEKVVIMRGDDE